MLFLCDELCSGSFLSFQVFTWDVKAGGGESSSKEARYRTERAPSFMYFCVINTTTDKSRGRQKKRGGSSDDCEVKYGNVWTSVIFVCFFLTVLLQLKDHFLVFSVKLLFKGPEPDDCRSPNIVYYAFVMIRCSIAPPIDFKLKLPPTTLRCKPEIFGE